MSDTAGSEELASWRGSSSIVWNYFRFGASDVNLERITYKECCRVVTQITHNCLKTQCSGCKCASSNISSDESVQRIGLSAHPSSSHQPITFDLILDKSPVNTGSNEGFGKMLSWLDAWYVILSLFICGNSWQGKLEEAPQLFCSHSSCRYNKWSETFTRTRSHARSINTSSVCKEVLIDRNVPWQKSESGARMTLCFISFMNCIRAVVCLNWFGWGERGEGETSRTA